MKCHLDTERCFYHIITLIVLFSSLATTAYSQEYRVRWAMMGNSITYGATLDIPATECYPAQLQDLLEEVYGDTVEIKNYGVSGRTMMRSAENPLWNEPQFPAALKFVPDICLILLGTNDSKPYRWDAWGNEFLGDYLAMVDTFKFRNPDTRFIVCYPPPIWEGHPYGTTFENSHNDSILLNCAMKAIDTVVQQTGAILVDFHTPFEDSLQLFPDKLHPNVTGQGIMAKMLFDLVNEKDLIHQVDQGRAFVSDFYQSVSPVAEGGPVELKWTTIFADSAFLDGVPVETSGSLEVIAEEGKIYTLIAKGPKNSSEFALVLNTYIPEESGMKINLGSDDYRQGLPVTLYSLYTDQYGKEMLKNTSNVTWTLISGEGQLEDQTDTSIVFVPMATGKVTIEAKAGELSIQKTITVNSLPSAVVEIKKKTLKIYPNPAGEKLYFQVKNLHSDDILIRVFDMTGRQIMEESFSAPDQDISTFELQTSDLVCGIYAYEVRMGSVTEYGRFLK